MRKSQLEAKLDQGLYRTTRQNAIGSGMIDERFDNNDDVEEEEENRENLHDESDFELSNAQSYANAIEVTQLQWREVDAIDCLNFSVLLHLQHSLHIANEKDTWVNKLFLEIS